MAFKCLSSDSWLVPKETNGNSSNTEKGFGIFDLGLVDSCVSNCRSKCATESLGRSHDMPEGSLKYRGVFERFHNPILRAHSEGTDTAEAECGPGP